MRILFLSTWHPYPPDNGSKLRALYLLRALSARHDVVAVAFRPPASGEGADQVTLAATQPIITVPDDPYRYVKVSQWVKYLSPSPLAYRPSLPMRETVASLCSGGPWDAVVAVQMPVAQYAQRVPAKCRVIDVDTAMTFQMLGRYQRQNRRLMRASNWISLQKARRYESKMLHHFQTATVVWQPEADLLQQMVKSSDCRVVVVPNGVDTAHNCYGFREHHPYTLVYNGSLTYSANYDAMRWFLAEVYPLVKAEQPNVRLTITGSTKGVDIGGLALDDSVCLTGFVDDVRIPVAEAALCVAPIRQGSGTRLKILEAMALGTPVVSTTKGSEGLDFVDGEHCLLADGPAQFARAVLTLLADAECRTRLASKARRLVEEGYDWSRIGERFATLIEDAAFDRPGSPAVTQ